MPKKVNGIRPQDITSNERLKRISAVEELLIKGASRTIILDFCKEKFKTRPVTSDLYIHEAKKLIKEHFEKHFDKDYFKANLFERLEDLYRQNMDIDDFRECRNIIKDFRDMLGFDAIIKTEVKLNVQTQTEEEILQELEALKSKIK